MGYLILKRSPTFCICRCKFFIMSTEFDKNISNRRYDYKNDLDFFLRLFKWPKIAVKKANFFRNFSNKSHSILMLHKIDKNKKVAPKLIIFNGNFFWNLRKILDIENWLWKSDFGTFWSLFLAINKSHKKSIPFLWSVQS